MLWIVLMMLGLIVVSIISDLVLPQAVKDRLGIAICWGMMAITMTFLGLSTLGLLFMITTRVLPQLFS